jgi:surface protein
MIKSSSRKRLQKTYALVAMLLIFCSCITREELLVASENQLQANQKTNIFKSTWRTTTPSESITLPLRTGFNYDFIVDWGDSSPVSIVSSEADLDKTHTYAIAGDYQVTITGYLEAWYFNNTGDSNKIISVSDFGAMGWINLERAFHGCSNLISFSGGDTSEVTTMYEMFRYAAMPSLDLTHFDTSKVTSMGWMFSAMPNLTSINLVGPGFDTSAVTDMQGMFRNSNLKSLDLSTFDTGNVGHMGEMFQNAADLVILDLSSFDTAGVGNMWGMFTNTTALTDLDLNNWDVSGGPTSGSIFTGMTATVYCDQDPGTGLGTIFGETCN